MKKDKFVKNHLHHLWTHKTLPIEIRTSREGKYTDWFITKLPYCCQIHELQDKQIEDVSEEEINLLLLKYSI